MFVSNIDVFSKKMMTGFCQRPESWGNSEENAERTGRGQYRSINCSYRTRKSFKQVCYGYLNVWLILLSQQAYSLEKFRSLQDKLLLLEEAVALYDGNVITAVSITWPMTSSFHIENWKNSVVSSINHILLHFQFPVSGLDLFKKVFK